MVPTPGPHPDPANSYVESLASRVMVFGDRAFERELGSDKVMRWSTDLIGLVSL